MKRASAAALLCALAACSSGGDDSDVARPVAERTRATTSTTGFEVDPEAGFRRALESRTGWVGADADAALEVVRGLCDLLGDESVEPDVAGVAVEVTLANYDGEDGLIMQVVVIGVEYFCPQHRAPLIEYMAATGVDTRP
jgi:hypothetical protein